MDLMFVYRMLVSFFVAAYFGACAPVQGPHYDPDAAYVQSLVRSAVVVRTTVSFTDASGLHSGREFGSGVVLGHDGKRTLVMTARHVCLPELMEPAVLPSHLHVHSVFDAGLNVHGAVVVFVGKEKDNDVCVLDAEGTVGDVAQVATDMPPVGGRVNLVGAPLMNYDDHMLYVSDGRYCGMQRVGPTLELYLETLSTPSAPGAPGGGLWYRGRLVGIVSMGRPGFTDVTLAVPLWYVRRDLTEALKAWRP